MTRSVPLVLLAAGLGVGVFFCALWFQGSERASLGARARPAAESGASREPHPSAEFIAPGSTRAPLASEPSAAARKIVVRVVTLTSRPQGATREGNLSFQVFSRRPLAEAPTARAAVRFLGIPLILGQLLHEGRTDDSGEAQVELDAAQLSFASEGEPLVCARLVEPGFQQRLTRARPPKDGGPSEIQLTAVAGATFRGRTVDPEARPVAAVVDLRRWIAPRGVRQLDFGVRAVPLAEGAFELHLAEGVVDGVLLADADEAGTGCLGGVELTLEAPRQDLEVVVRGAGSIRGRVTDASGAPAAGLALCVLLAELDDAARPDPAFDDTLHALEGLGRTRVLLLTDPDGRFEARGLRPEPYFVLAGTGAKFSQRLTPRPILANGDELELRLARPHLAVRLRGPKGEPWSADPLVLRRPEGGLRSLPSAWPSSPTVMVFPCTPTDQEAGVLGDALEGTLIALDEAVYEVPDGARYLVGAMGAAFDGSLQVVEVPPGASRVPVELQARSMGEFGAVSVRVLHAGRELSGDVRDNLEVSLESGPTAARLLERDPYRGRAPFVFRAPAGTYRVVAAGKAYTDYQHGTLMVPRAMGRSEAECVLIPGTTQDLVLELDDGARLELELMGEASEADRRSVLTSYPWLADPEHAAQLASWAARAELALVHGGRRPEPVLFSGPDYQGTSAAGVHLKSGWPLGQVHRSEILPTGRYTLLARLPGGRAARVEVELRAGATTAVKLEF